MKLVLLLVMLFSGFLLGEEIVLPYDKNSVKVMDGDTIKLNVSIKDCPALLCKQLPVRLARIDTAESRSTNEHELALALEAKEELIKFLDSAPYYVHSCKRDTYFRVDCEITNVNGINYSDYIVSKRLAIYYKGLKKTYDWSTHVK